jgi:hypothetical protein
MVIVLVTGSKFAGSNPADSDAFLRVTEVRSMTFFGGEVNYSCRKFLWHV